MDRAGEGVSEMVMTVRVKFFSTLVQYTKSQQAEYEMAWRSGMTVQDIIDAEELSAADAEAIAAVVNLAQAQPDTELQDGDAVEFLVNLQGGSGVCVGLVSTGGWSR
jgi:molybdopterin converting factor small subunit